jgi:hypothetical protein
MRAQRLPVGTSEPTGSCPSARWRFAPQHSTHRHGDTLARTRVLVLRAHTMPPTETSGRHRTELPRRFDALGITTTWAHYERV